MEPVNLLDFEGIARGKVPAPVFDFIAGGAEDEITLAENRAAYGRIRLLPRVLVDVSNINTSAMVLGRRLDMPVLLAPVALQRLAHPDGEQAVARAAAQANVIQVLSTMSACTLEEAAAAAEGPKWFQLYCYRDREITKHLVQRAEAAGYEALCLTVDLARLGRRERDLRHATEFPPDILPMNLVKELGDLLPPDAAESPVDAYRNSLLQMTWELLPNLTWKDLDWFRSFSKLPIVLKGIHTAADARLAVEHGAQAIIVSNHGGRQLDTVPATIEMLPEIADAVAGRIPVLVDGGIRRGTDVVKALALGATAVLIGRPYIWALAYNGEDGVRLALNMLKAEFELAMALCGCTSVAEIGRGLVRLPGE